MQSRFTSLLKRLVTVDDTVLDQQFTLIDDESDTSYEADGNKHTPEVIDFDTDENKTETRRPVSMREFIRKGTDEYNEAVRKSHVGQDDALPVSIDEMKQRLERFFHLPQNKDVVVREFSVGVHTNQPWRGLAVFIDGMADKTVINRDILERLMLFTEFIHDEPRRNMEYIAENLLTSNQTVTLEKWSQVVQTVLSGSTAVLLDGCNGALSVETKGWEHRSVGTPQTESVVRGAHDSFTESFRANTGLVRARFRSEHLVTEMFSVGNLATTDVAVMYVHGMTNPKLVREVRRRIEAVDVDYISSAGMLEQFIEDQPSRLIPQVLSTERPDRVAASLAEGYVAIFVGNNPYVLIAPVVLYSMVHTSEDANLRFQAGTFIRCLRWVALFVALLLPSLYVAVTNYHPEMLPTDLMLAIAGSREQVPFPVIVEILLMEFAIELIREAGIRIPSVIGPTIGIVGALIIGQAAVQAGIVSPLLVIVVATTALAGFAIPNYELSMAIRITRFIFLLAGAVLGFYGIAILGCVYVVRLSMQKSFGVPILAPIAPSKGSSKDVLLRGPVYTMNRRPVFLNPLRSWRQQPITRPWSSDTGRRKGSGENGSDKS
ncbi:spore germination protein [Alicyclobacillus fastidiosus]|uniref:Spore germination protein n=1 Tax=Alicyclobacillus fastidiosus TaxID=392011 RepID=A0ABV5AJ54_9BACL|nr:spore germination protein [Alicyclobacillus fastidiosus]WEH09337.1 spore germination protein [Alicyclobacillus fastidiosus]